MGLIDWSQLLSVRYGIVVAFDSSSLFCYILYDFIFMDGEGRITLHTISVDGCVKAPHERKVWVDLH